LRRYVAVCIISVILAISISANGGGVAGENNQRSRHLSAAAAIMA